MVRDKITAVLINNENYCCAVILQDCLKNNRLLFLFYHSKLDPLELLIDL